MSFTFNWSAISAGAPFVTISALGLAFNSISIAKLGSPDEVMVGFDEQNLAIGVRAYHGEVGVKSYKFASRVKTGWVRIGCKDFIRYLGTLTGNDYSKAHKYVACFDKETDCLIVKLQQENVTDEND